MATITADSLAWYGFDADGAGVHDVIGTRCDPYTEPPVARRGLPPLLPLEPLPRLRRSDGRRSLAEAEFAVHDVLNVFMCTGFTRDTHQYFMKASPVRPGDFLEFFAEIDLLGALSACPGGDCSATHSSDAARCFPLAVEILAPKPEALAGWRPPDPSPYRHPAT
ncbi:MAG: DUF1989 domain-containing protein [Acetobacteraceae bacterium]|nr:DUF1989 domain-containing protein [Acetobacteraceae bacterium]